MSRTNDSLFLCHLSQCAGDTVPRILRDPESYLQPALNFRRRGGCSVCVCVVYSLAFLCVPRALS